MALATAADVRLAIPSGSTLASSVVDDLLAAADAAAKSYMGRTLESGSYSQRIPAARPMEPMHLDEFPVTSVESINIASSNALDVWNAGAARATVSINETGVHLREFFGGVWIPTSILFATATTLDDLVTAIQAVAGSRWDAELSSEVLGTEPSSELTSLVGPLNVAGSVHATLQLMDGDVPTDWDYDEGKFWLTECGAREGETILVNYSAGYATIPPDVVKAVGLLAAEIYAQSNASVAAGMRREKLGDYEGERFQNNSTAIFTPTIVALLCYWRSVFV